MKAYRMHILLAVVVAAVTAGPLMAQRPGEGQPAGAGRRNRNRQAGPGYGRAGGPGAGPTAQGDRLRLQMRQLQSVFTEEQKAEAGEIRKGAREEIAKATRETIKKAVKQIEGLLTDGQKQAIKDTRDSRHNAMMAQLDLTDEQQEQIDQLRQTADEEADATYAPGEKRAILRQMRIDINDVLTDEQRAKARSSRGRRRRGSGLGLTEEQEVRFMELHKKHAKMREQMRKDFEQVLTPEQLEKWKAFDRDGRQGVGPGRGGRMGPGGMMGPGGRMGRGDAMGRGRSGRWAKPAEDDDDDNDDDD